MHFPHHLSLVISVSLSPLNLFSWSLNMFKSFHSKHSLSLDSVILISYHFISLSLIQPLKKITSSTFIALPTSYSLIFCLLLYWNHSLLKMYLTAIHSVSWNPFLCWLLYNCVYLVLSTSLSIPTHLFILFYFLIN